MLLFATHPMQLDDKTIIEGYLHKEDGKKAPLDAVEYNDISEVTLNLLLGGGVER